MSQCAPPEDVTNATYAPVQNQYELNDEVTYKCDDLHHYVKGITQYKCQKSGSFPTPDIDCSGNWQALGLKYIMNYMY